MNTNVRVEDVLSYDQIKNNLFVKLCSVDNVNPDYYYNEKLGICETYHILVSNDGDSLKSIPVTHQLLKLWAGEGCDVGNIRSDALESGEKLFPSNTFSLNNFLGFADGEVETYVLSVTGGMYGASAMMYPKALKKLCYKLHTDSIIILPSSIHEVIVLPFTKEMAEKDLDGMIQSINASVVEDDDILADKAYFYNKDMDGLIYLSDYLDVFKD